jgi:hypothetical protein
VIQNIEIVLIDSWQIGVANKGEDIFADAKVIVRFFVLPDLSTISWSLH